MVIVEKSIVEYFNNYKSDSFKTGVLIGQICDKKTFLLTQIPCPELPSNDNQSSITWDEWLLTHAHHVKKMLCGGMLILGFYIISSESTIQQLSKTIQSIASKFLLIIEFNLCYICQCPLSPRLNWMAFYKNSNSFKNISIKSTSISGNQIHTFTCSVSVNIPIPLTPLHLSSNIPNIPSKDTHLHLFQTINTHWQKLIQAFDCIEIDNCHTFNIIPEEKNSDYSITINSLFPSTTQHSVKIFLKSFFENENNEITLAGIANFQGIVSSQIIILNKQPLSILIDYLLEDFLKTLSDRTDLYLEELNSINSSFSLNHGFQLILPRRIFFPIPSTNMLFCDYLTESDSIEYAISRIYSLLGISINHDDIIFLEPQNSNSRKNIPSPALPFQFPDLSHFPNIQNMKLSSLQNITKLSIAIVGITIALLLAWFINRVKFEFSYL